MVREIIQDEAFLAIPSEDATTADAQLGQDLLETLIAHKDECVGMAANMIGVSRRIIAIHWDGQHVLMYNPRILRQEGVYEAEEGCLSLSGTRKTVRYGKIRLSYQNEKFQPRIHTFTGWTAQIIQHEVDHCEGKLI